MKAFNESCTNAQVLPNSTTITTTTETPVRSDPFYPKGLSFGGPDINELVSDFLSNFTPALYNKYASKISEGDADEVRSFIHKTLETNGFTVDEKAFPVFSSIADKKNPNTVEIVMDNYTIQVNNATDSLGGFHPFSGFSPKGIAIGPLVYANFATEDDFRKLETHNISINGSILLVRLCDLHPGVQVRNAEEKGAVGVILYPDPHDFGGSTNDSISSNRSLPSDGVVWQNLRMTPGDPSTPYYASQKDVFRTRAENFDGIPSIVVQPVSGDSALTLLEVLGGTEVHEEWKGDLNITYKFGGSFKDDNVKNISISSYNRIVETHQHIIFAYPPSEDHSKVIQIGCHYDIRDSNLTSSGIGLAGILALSEALHKTFPNGTDRLIVLSVFEGRDGDFSVGHEYSQLYSWWIETTTLAYVDMDEVLEGNGFVKANVSPLLRKVVREALHHVPWVGIEGITAYQGIIDSLPHHLFNPSKKDKGLYQETFHFDNPYECDEAFNFINVHGIPSLQLTAIHLNKSLEFHLRNSQYDTMNRIQKYEDEELHWISAMSLSALLLSFLPLPLVKFNEVGLDLSNAWKSFREEEKNILDSHIEIRDICEKLSSEFDKFILTTEGYDAWYKDGMDLVGMTPLQQFRAIERRVEIFQQFGRKFLRPRNVPGHSSFGSLISYGPSVENSCEGTYFPFIKKALKDAVQGKGSWNSLQEELSLLLSSLIDIRTDT
ncbi:N-acetylated-alpha-linked acidic dipeptidase-like protein [Armadillidium vulgare]|nr:N-acetylated-alpha-linked acidic dipeptidase-like protein [Armadillidium vulgare]